MSIFMNILLILGIVFWIVCGLITCYIKGKDSELEDIDVFCHLMLGPIRLACITIANFVNRL